MRSSRLALPVLAAFALFGAACAAGDDQVLSKVNGIEITQGDVIDSLVERGEISGDEGVINSDLFNGALSGLQADALFLDDSATAASVNGAAVSVGELMATFDAEAGTEVDPADLASGDLAARLRNMIFSTALEEGFVDLGFMTESGVGSPTERAEAIDSVMNSEAFMTAAADWFDTEADLQTRRGGNFCLTLLVTTSAARADEFSAKLATGENLDGLAADLDPVTEQGGDDCRTLNAFPDSISNVLLELVDGQTSDAIVIDPVEGVDAPTSYVFVRRNSITDANRVFLLDAVRRVEVSVHPGIGTWDANSLSVEHGPSSP
jgi:hypothetical protein